MPTQTKLKHLVNRDLFSNYYLDNLLTESDAWNALDEEKLRSVFEKLKNMYFENKLEIKKCSEDSLEDKFIKPIFTELGLKFGTREKVDKIRRFPDYAIFESKKDLRRAYDNKGEKDFYSNALTIAEAKRWGQNLDKMDKSGNVRDFSNPSHQVYAYQQETEVDWAILTNGQKWRLYYSKTSHKVDSYYEVDLPIILEMDGEEGYEAFKYFYLFFRVEAFVKNVRGTCFLDRIFEKSNIFSQELEDDLKENIYEAIKQLAQGFLNYSENKLDPGSDMKLIHDSSLVYLYRLIFVLYAESEGRDLLDTNNRIYDDDYSLNSLKQQVCEGLEKDTSEFKGWQTKIWDRLEELFVLIDKGSKSKKIPEEQLYIPAYNGGLFRTDVDDDAAGENVFLNNNKVSDQYMAKVIDLLTRHESKNGKGRVFVDYSSLNIRHLGSIYEGLLEYHLNVASEKMVAVKEKKEQKWYAKSEFEGDGNIIEELDEGEVYLTTDKGERKATGSYYTPEYIVQYIVENTLDPILERIKDELLRESGGNFANEFAERVFKLKVLDPAMGSGHFLTNAVDHLAREIINARDKQAEEQGIDTIDESHDIHWARRQVAQRCIYGVDLNPMAVELAKVSLWLRTLAARQPLAFLDHHLKTGNSLIGSDIEDIEELDSVGKKTAENIATLEDFGMTWKGTMEDLMTIYQDFIKIENQELSDIKEMEEKFHEFEHEPIKERLEAMANVHTAREFGIPRRGQPTAGLGHAEQHIGDGVARFLP
ncbi:MAG: DNA methyltransferase, partial [Thermoplasmata archaeon]